MRPSVMQKYPLFVFWIAVSFLYCAIFVSIELSSVPAPDFKGVFLWFGQWCLISAGAAGIIGLMLLNRIVFALLFPILSAINSAVAYFTLSIGVGLNAVSLEIALVNDMTMWATVINPALIIAVLSGTAIAVCMALIRWRINQPSIRYMTIYALLSLILTLIPAYGGNRVYSAMMNRMPFSIYNAIDGYIDNSQEIKTIRNTFDLIPVKRNENAPDIILVIGESLRADHLPMNGYHRNTMPLFGSDTATISFPDIYSGPTHTYTSVPRIMTRADESSPDLAYNEQSFITLFSKAGYSTAWFANQDIAVSYTYFAHEADTLVYGNSARSLYTYNKWLDTDLLDPICEWLQNSDKKNCGPLLGVIHTIGSHWWYKSHYTDSPDNFMPDTRHKDISRLTHEEIVNAYDNSILATDLFLKRLSKLVENRNAIIIFISDHGESLGEDGTYLHASETEPLHHPACLIWYSSKYISSYPEKIAALRKNRLESSTTDVVFHTTIDAAGLETSVLDKTKSLFYEKKDTMD